ncbi:Imm3 family immunity protein [Brevibacillus gelatini]|uniref:Imm3 family immunity protein n=1 Tax=Brevibacillus gelatini TaxID=1655277 RepID=UPI0011CD6485|nr:Imm3 family immunity protein [Brevibacillus gelatini]
MNWSYYELLTAVYDTYFEYKDENFSDYEALARTTYDFELSMNEGEVEKAAIYIALARIALTHSKISVRSKEIMREVLANLNVNHIREHLSTEEVEDLLERRDYILRQFDNNTLPLNHDPRARWYYHELTKEVKVYFDNVISVTSSEEIAHKVLKRFERDCKNTLSENITIKVTLAEILINKGINAQEELNNIKHELKQFNIEDVGQQLSEEEKEDLARRIKSLLINI